MFFFSIFLIRLNILFWTEIMMEHNQISELPTAWLPEFPNSTSEFLWIFPKSQMKPKAVWARRRFSQKTNEWICFASRENQNSK